MKMKNLLVAITLAFAYISCADAASCAASAAAQAGAQTAYKKDADAAKSWAEREKNAEKGASKCLGDISTSIKVPSFPDFSQVTDKIKDKVCTTVRDSMSSLLPSNIDPWSDLTNGKVPKLPSASLPDKNVLSDIVPDAVSDIKEQITKPSSSIDFNVKPKSTPSKPKEQPKKDTDWPFNL